MFISDHKRKVINGLRWGPMNQSDLAVTLNEAPFSVRAELRDLKRMRLVSETLTSERHVYELTPRGWEVVHSGDQLRVV